VNPVAVKLASNLFVQRVMLAVIRFFFPTSGDNDESGQRDDWFDAR
jgi:hypothetical protein